MSYTKKVFSSERGFGMVEMVVASGLIIIFILAASSLHAIYQSTYSTMAKNTKARTLGLQMVSEMKGHYGRYPFARVSGTDVAYRRCYGRNLELIPNGTEAVRVLTDRTLNLCTGAYQVDIIPNPSAPKVFLIEVKIWVSISNSYEPAGSYNVAF